MAVMTDSLAPASPGKEHAGYRVQFRASAQLHAFLVLRAIRAGSIDLQARAELETWRAVLAAERRRIRLTLAEASCVADVLSGHLITHGTVLMAGGAGVCYAECHDAFRLSREAGEPGYGAKWGISEDELLAKLQRLGPAADLALEDAIARWWGRKHPEPTVEGFAEVGLRVIQAAA